MNAQLEGWLSIPKSIYVCLRLLPIKQALRMPIKVRYNVKLQSLTGRVILPDNPRKAQIQIGFQYVGTHDVTYRRTVLEIDGTLQFLGTAYIGSGSQLCVGRDGHLVAGDNFQISCAGQVVCLGNMTIGSRFLMGWEGMLLDTDFHTLENVQSKEITKAARDVTIGNNVWTGARSIILKGSNIADGSVVGANSVVSGQFTAPNCIIAGNPGKVIKEGFTRKV